MSLPVKNSRPITIEGIPCRWMISGNKNDAILRIIIQSDNGGKLIVNVEQEIEGLVWLYDKNGNNNVGPITPNWIIELAEMAIEIGWFPNQITPYTLEFINSKLSKTILSKFK